MRAAALTTPEAARRRPLHPVVRATGWVSFFTDLGSEIIYPLLPEFVTTTLGAPKAVFGLIEGLAEGTPALVKYLSGALSDRVANRKWLVLAGYGLSSAVKPLIGLAKFTSLAVAPYLVLVLRVTDKLGKGIRGAPRDALVADYSEGQQGRAFGFQRAMDHAGAVGGGLVAFALVGLLGLDISRVILLSVIPGALSLLVIALFVREKPGHASRAAARPTSAPPPLTREFRTYAVAAVLFALANSSDAFLLIRAKEMGLAVALFPLVWALLHVVKAVTSLVGGRLSDRLGRRPLLIGGWVLYGLVYVGFAAFDTPLAVWILFPVYGMFYGATEGAAKAFVADLVPAGSRGRAFGVLGMLEGLMLIPTGLAVGWLWDVRGSGELALALEAGIALTAALWLAFAVRPARLATTS
jgi:MFS family permease